MSVEERLRRERLRDLAKFERLHGNPSKSSPDLAVKKFCRTISMKYLQASDVRPLPVLVDTLNYVLNIWKCGEHPFEVVHDFIFDRIRSVRQDLSMQNLSNDNVISMYERMVEFHVISDHIFRLGDRSNETSSKSYLNMEQLTKTLTSLYNLYEVNRNAESIYPKEAEFRSLYVLLHLHADNQVHSESLHLWFCYASSNILNSKEMHFARKVLRYFRLGNFKRFIYSIEAEASYLQYCILEPHISEVRAFAISCVNTSAYKLQPFSLLELAKLLLIKESELQSLCRDCGLSTSSDEVGNSVLPSKQTTFSYPKREAQRYYPLDSERFSEG
ncbi:hypothetical protein Leryth_016633 [Lithospermum erythrorhizon]|nr:hypothetical protein Leryth_016633 [Lithospermum erythrorhizon]